VSDEWRDKITDIITEMLMKTSDVEVFWGEIEKLAIHLFNVACSSLEDPKNLSISLTLNKVLKAARMISAIDGYAPTAISTEFVYAGGLIQSGYNAYKNIPIEDVRKMMINAYMSRARDLSNEE